MDRLRPGRARWSRNRGRASRDRGDPGRIGRGASVRRGDPADRPVPGRTPRPRARPPPGRGTAPADRTDVDGTRTGATLRNAPTATDAPVATPATAGVSGARGGPRLRIERPRDAPGAVRRRGRSDRAGGGGRDPGVRVRA